MYNPTVQNIAKDCSGNAKDEYGNILDPITMDPLPRRELVTLVKIGNLCYNRDSLREYLLSKNPYIDINLDNSTPDEYAIGAVGRIEDPFTRIMFTEDQLKKFHELVSNHRSRECTNCNSLNETKMADSAWRKGGKINKKRSSRRSSKSSRSRSRSSRRRSRSSRRKSRRSKRK